MAADKKQEGHLVLDAGAFITGCRVWEYAAQLYAVHEIKKEVRDAKARQMLDSGLFDLQLLEPSREAFRRVVAFARATGDYAALSAVDLKVLALTLQLELEQNGERFVREAPQRPVFAAQAPSLAGGLPKAATKKGGKGGGKGRGKGKGNGGKGPAKSKKRATEGTEKESTAEETETETETVNEAEAETGRAEESVAEKESSGGEEKTAEVESAAAESAAADAERETAAATSADVASAADEEEEEEEEDEGEWVTPDNFVAVVLGNSQDIEAADDKELQRVHVSCLTTDFAMQNVLLQMGLRVTSVEGLRIHRTKTWILRCIACFKVVQDRERLFCPHCGHDSLRKISVSVDESGAVQYYNSQKQVSIRGTRYSLPKPKGGRYGASQEPITCEDQLLKRGRRRKERKVDPFDPEFVFASKQRNARAGVGVGRRGNPNESRRRGKGKKK